MALSDLKLTLNWAFGLSSGTKAAMKEAKLGMEDMHGLMIKQNKLYDTSGLKAENFYKELTNNANEHIKARKSQEAEIAREAETLYNNLVAQNENYGISFTETLEKMKNKYGEYANITEATMRRIISNKEVELGMTEKLIEKYRGLQESLDKYYKTEKLQGAEQRQARAMSLHSGEQIRKQIDNIAKGMITSGQISEEQSSKMSDNLLEMAMAAENPIETIGEIAKSIERLNSAEMGTFQFEKASKDVGKLSDNIMSVGDGAESIEDVTKNTTKLSKASNKASDNFENMTDSLKSTWGRMKGLAEGPISTFFAAAAAAASVTDAAHAHTEVTRDIAQLNLQVADSSATLHDKQTEYMQGMREVGTATSTRLSEVHDVMNSLARARVGDTREELQGLAQAGLEMEYAFGLSRGASADLMRNLKVVGGLGQEEIRGVGDAMATVQKGIGLTSEEATEAAATIGTVVNQMMAMGGEVDNIEIVAEETAKMAAMFNKAGLSAQDASQMINKLMDPSQIEENALMFSRLGMSVDDAFDMMAGGGEQMAGMSEKMGKLAYDLTQQYEGQPRVLNEMAKLHGMDLQMVGKLARQHEEIANMTAEERKNMEAEAELSEQAAAAREGINEQLSRAGAQLNVILHGFVVPLVSAISWVLEPLVGWIQKLNEIKSGFAEAHAGLGKALEILTGFVALFALLSGPLLLKLLGGLKFVPKLIGMAAGAPIKLLSRGIGSMTSRLSESNGILGKMIGKFKQQNDLVEKQNKIGGNKFKQMADGIKKIPARQLMAIGFAILMIAGGIALMVFSLTQLAKVMKDMELEQMIVFFIGSIALVATMLGLMIPLVGALGAVSAKAALPILAVGAAIFLMAIGVGIIIYSLAFLLEKIVELGATFDQMAGAALMLVAVLIPLGVTLVLLGKFGVMAAPGLLAVGAAFLMMGAGAAMAAVGIGVLLSIMSRMEADTLQPMVSMMGEITVQILAMSGAVMALAGSLTVLTVVGAAFTVVAVAMIAASVAFVGAVLLMTTMVPFLWLLGKATDNVSENIYKMGQGMKWMGEHTSVAKESLKGFKEAISDFEVPESFNKAMSSFATIGFISKMFGEDIKAFGDGLLNVGIGVEKISKNSENLSNSISNVKEGINELKNTNIEELSIMFEQLGTATVKAAENFNLMGKGISMMADGLASIIQNLEKMSGILSDSDFNSLLEGFGDKINKINNNMTPPRQAGPEVQSMIEMDRNREEALRGSDKEGISQSPVVDKLGETNAILGNIDSKMERVVDLLSRKGSNVVESKTSVETS